MGGHKGRPYENVLFRLDFPSNHVHKKTILLALVLAGCKKSGSPGADAARADSAAPAPAQAGQIVAFRIPTTGGALSIYSLPNLEPASGGAGSRLAGVRTAV